MAPWTNAVLAILALLAVNGTISGVVPATSICKLSTTNDPVEMVFADKVFNPFIVLLFAPSPVVDGIINNIYILIL